LYTQLYVGLLSGILPSGFPINILYAFLLSLICDTWHAHLILLDFIILIILGEEYKLLSFSFREEILNFMVAVLPQSNAGLIADLASATFRSMQLWGGLAN
jgi:hypothetical protein